MFFSAQPDLVERWIGEDLAVFGPPGTDLHVLNETAAKIYHLCDGSHTPEDMADMLVKSFDGVEYDRAYEDVKRILIMFEEKNIVVAKK